MGSLKRRSKKIMLCAVLLAELLTVFPFCVYAEVTAVPEGYAQDGAVYVAGNPDCYPVEYYDEKKECYRGVVPELLEDISETAGVDFVYVNAGNKDQRKQLAENRQVELLTGCFLGENLSVGTGKPFLSLTIGEKTHDIVFGYTEIASVQVQESIENYIANLPEGEMARRVATFTAENQQEAVPLWVWFVICGLCGGLAAAVLWIILKIKKRTEENEVSQQIDPGTGAWNRKYFLQQFSQVISSDTCTLYYLIYLHFDIGRVNEYYGEDEAEELLRYAADTLGRCTVIPNFFARVSGGGFAVLHQFVSQEQAEEWMQNTLSELNRHSEKFGQDYTPKFYAGIYNLQPEITGETAIYAANQGCLNAEKENLPYIFCDEKLLRSRQELERLRHEVIRAIERREFQCYMQFIARADTGMVYGAELLSRWYHPEFGLLMPGKYISDMEKSGTIIELDFYMFEEACRLLVQLEKQGLGQLSLFCNFSRRTISLKEFSNRIKTIAERYHFNHNCLYLEITESCMFDSEEAVKENIRHCRQEGFRIALDDVGSGYSSFSDLANYPVDMVKIDRTLLLGAVRESGYRLLRGMNTLFHHIQIKTLCEGAETPEQCQMIRELGVDLIQGFCIQRALPIDEALYWLKEKDGKLADGWQ